MNSVHSATTSGPPTAVMGLSCRFRTHATSEAAPTAMSTGTIDSRARTTLRSRTAQEQEDEQDGQVGEQDAVRLDVLQQAHAHHGQAGRRGLHALGDDHAACGLARSSSPRISSTYTARSLSEPGPVRNTRLRALASGLTALPGCPAAPLVGPLHVDAPGRQRGGVRHLQQERHGGRHGRGGQQLLGVAASSSLAKSVTKATVSSLNTSSDSMKMPSSADEPVSA